MVIIMDAQTAEQIIERFIAEKRAHLAELAMPRALPHGSEPLGRAFRPGMRWAMVDGQLTARWTGDTD